MNRVGAWLDESIREETDGVSRYLLGAVLIEEKDRAEIREKLREISELSGKLHWHDMGPQRREDVLPLVVALKARHVIVVAATTHRLKPERARKKCLERMTWELTQRPEVATLVLEQRSPTQDRRDIDAFSNFRSRFKEDSKLRVEHGAPKTEPLLWIPDTVIGALGDTLIGKKDWSNYLDVRQVDIGLD